MKNISVCLMIFMILVVFQAILFAQSYPLQSGSNPTYFYQGMTAAYPLQNYLQTFPQRYNQYRNLSSTYAAAGWLDHPPVFVNMPNYPIVLKAGQSSTIPFRVIDPDLERLYVSSNIGSTGSGMGGNMMWSFSPNFPGNYLVDTMVYDERGGFALMRYPVSVKPWWSF